MTGMGEPRKPITILYADGVRRKLGAHSGVKEEWRIR